MTRRSILALSLLLALVAGACGGDSPAGTEAPSQPAADQPTQPASDTSDGMAPDDSEDESMDDESMDDEPMDDGTAADGPAIEGPAAPDFTLAMGDGSTFTMSEATNPVYLVFWAEW